jgi:transcriptional regulator with XRE-family HTH domain
MPLHDEFCESIVIDGAQEGSIGARVQTIRERRGLKRAALAAKLGVGEGAIRKIEDGLTRQPKFSNGLRLAATLGVWPDEVAFESAFRSDLNVTIDGTPVEIRLRIEGVPDPGRQRTIADIIKNALVQFAPLASREAEKNRQELLDVNECIGKNLKAMR